MANNHQVRIIAGKWRGRKLKFQDYQDLRPTPDRVRETLFNWLAPYIVDSNCLDAFAGSGALGIEAASRGARSVTLLEKVPVIHKKLKETLQSFDADNVACYKEDAINFFQRCFESFDIVFLDPPFKANLLQTAVDTLHRGKLVASGGLVYLESDKKAELKFPDDWQCLKEKEAGMVKYQLWQVESYDGRDNA